MTDVKRTELAPAQSANDPWFTRTPEQEGMQAAVRDFVGHHAPVERLLARGDDQAATDDMGLWKLLHEQLGAQAVTIPEEYGGLGLGIEELCALLEETGAQLAFPSLFSTLAQAVPLLSLSADVGVRKTWLSRVAAGNCVATVAYLQIAAASRCLPGCGRSNGACSGYLDGTAALVLDADTCDVLLVLALSAEGARLFLVESGSGGITTQNVDSIDPPADVRRVLCERRRPSGRVQHASGGGDRANV